jgi:hypothetical protein
MVGSWTQNPSLLIVVCPQLSSSKSLSTAKQAGISADALALTLAALPYFCLCACGGDGLAALCWCSHFQGKVFLCLQVKRLGKAMVDSEAADTGPLEDAEDTSSSESEDKC